MSKSKNNGVDPEALVKKYGADTARLYTMFTAPPESTLEWSESGVEGAHKYLKRLWAYAHDHRDQLDPAPVEHSALDSKHKTLRHAIHEQLRSAQFDYERNQYNTVVSSAMKILNTLGEVAPEEKTPAQRRPAHPATHPRAHHAAHRRRPLARTRLRGQHPRYRHPRA